MRKRLVSPATGMTKEEELALQSCFASPECVPFMKWLFKEMEFMEVVSTVEMMACQGLGIDIFDSLCKVNPRLAGQFVIDNFIGKGGEPDGNEGGRTDGDDGDGLGAGDGNR